MSIEAGSKGPFEYPPLPSNQIRLLEVLNDSNPPACKVTTAVLDGNCPLFSAISYTWDNQIATESIQCSGRELLVTPNVRRIIDLIATWALSDSLLDRRSVYQSARHRGEDSANKIDAKDLLCR
jgi:hypothetical protein